MKRHRNLLCIALIALILPLAAGAARLLPFENREFIEKKYSGWSGVLRVWVFEGWENGVGSFTGWLNRCASSFEKAHNGVYVQIKSVDEHALRTFATSGVRPPDAILFPPGLLDSAAGLAVLPEGLNLRKPLHTSAYAAPVALGGYAWAISAEELPEHWEGLSAAAAPDDAFHSRSAALLALCSGVTHTDEGAPSAGMDLGLAEESAPTVETEIRPFHMKADFSRNENAWKEFVNGNVDALLVDQKDIAELLQLADRGKGPEWRLIADGMFAFSDQMLLMGVVDGDDAVEALCAELLLHLLSDGCQEMLASVGAFSVTGAYSGYPAHDVRASVELSLRSERLRVPPAFGRRWREEAAREVEAFLKGEREAGEALSGLFA